MEKKNYIVAIDLGSSNVVVAVGEKHSGQPLDVACVISKPSDGVNAGKIENIELVSKSVKEAITEAETKLGIQITEAYAGISGEFVRCARHTDHVFISDPQSGASRQDVDALFDRMRNVQAPDNEAIMDHIPQNYIVDDKQEVENPVGSFGRKLSSTFNFILCQKPPMQRLDMALKRLGIRLLAVYPNALAAPEAVVLPDEKEEGVAVVDIGGGTTDVTVYYRNIVRYTATVPMGAMAINRDIRTMGVPEKHIESLKQKYGWAVAELAPEDKLIRVNGRTTREAKDILLRNLATVIEARATDIAEFVLQEIKDSGFSEKLVCGIILTGGSAQLQGIDALFKRITGMDVRISAPEAGFSEQTREQLDSPAYATVAGILLRGGELGSCVVREQQPIVVQPQSQPGTSPLNGAFRPVPKPIQQPAAPIPPATSVAPKPEVVNQDKDDFDEEAQLDSKQGKRDWGSIFQKTIEKINKSFSAAEDEEI